MACKFFALFLFSLSSVAAADWSMQAQRGALQGALSLGGQYYFLESPWSTGLSMGGTPGEKREIYQITANVVYNTDFRPINEEWSWVPLRTGSFITYTPDSDFFIGSPGRYPKPENEPYYYEPNAIRLGLIFGSKITWSVPESRGVRSISAFIDVVTTDIHAIAYFNNRHHLSIFDIFGWGYGLEFHF